MSTDLIKFGYVAGELAPTFFGRSDLEKFDLAMAQIDNWLVDYRGGLATRPGFYFREFVYLDQLDTKMFEFKFNTDIANVYVLLFGHHYLRFLQNGGYVLEGQKVITAITSAAPGMVTSVAHGFVNDDWVQITDVVGMTALNGRTFQVAGATADTFTLKDPFGADFSTVPLSAYISGGTARRIYTLVTTYDSTDLVDLAIQQRGDTLILTHSNYRPRELVRTAHTNWTLAQTVFTNSIAPPTNLLGSPSAAGTAGLAWGVTTINERGEESVVSDIKLERLSVDYATTAGSYSMKWDGNSSAVRYNVYRSIILSDGKQITRGQQLGYLGNTKAPVFTDNNIIPDFTHQPPVHNDPFANGAIDTITVTAQGSGYDDTTTVTITDAGGGTGFAGYPIVAYTGSSHGATGAAASGAGEILGVVITNRGKNYITPVVVFTGGGALATATATLTPATGNNPATAAVFQQRQLYAATDNKPITVFGSKPKRFSNFDFSDVVLDNDSYEFDIDSEEVTPIRHLLAVRGGLLLFTQSDIFIMTGGGLGTAVTPTNALSEVQSYTGASRVKPLKIDTELLYVEAKSFVVRLLSYNEFSKIYKGEDVSILSNHLFGVGRSLLTWTYAAAPHKLVLGLREDGIILCFTIVNEQKIYSWAKWNTLGYYTDVLSILENSVDTIYTTTKRLVNGRWTKFIEQGASRLHSALENCVAVDCGLSTTPFHPAFTITPSALTGVITLTPSGGTFTYVDIGKVVRLGGGKGVITAVNLGIPTVTLTRDIGSVNPGTSTPLTLVPGRWSMDVPFNSVSGLWHLVGQTVVALVDGNVVKDLVVDTNGKVALGRFGTLAHVGLPYTCVARTLPPTAQGAILEGRRKSVPGIKIQQYKSRGVKVGRSLDNLYDSKERTNEAWEEPTQPQTGTVEIIIERDWDNEGQTYIVQDDPLPVTLLGHVIEVDVGDDND